MGQVKLTDVSLSLYESIRKIGNLGLYMANEAKEPHMKVYLNTVSNLSRLHLSQLQHWETFHSALQKSPFFNRSCSSISTASSLDNNKNIVSSRDRH